MDDKINYISIYSKLMSLDETNNIINSFDNTFSKAGLTNESDESYEKNYKVYFIVTGGTENDTINYIHKYHKKNLPVILIAHSGNNSLPASLEILAKLRLDNRLGKIIFFPDPGNEEAINELINAVHFVNVYSKLQNSQLGLIGEPSDWLIASQPAHREILDNWGIEIQKIQIDELRKYVNEINISEYSGLVEDFKSNSCKIVEPTEKEISDSIKVYAGLKQLVQDKNYNALTIRCFDLVVEDKTTGCYALSKLIDEEIIAGCEGDIPSTIGMLWSHLMTNQIPWMANPASIEVQSSTIKLAHCTVPRKIVKSYDIRSHFESGLGVGIQGEMKQGPVTLLRLGGNDLKSIWITEGQLEWKGNAENLCRTQAEVVVKEKSVLEELLRNPLGNHIVMIHGHYADKLIAWHKEFIK